MAEGIPPAMNFAPIVITLQKKNAADDVLKITPNPNSSVFDVVFEQNTISNRVMLTVEQYDISNYLLRFLKPLAFDETGYDFVQVDCPGYSSIILRTANVENYFPILNSQVLAHLACWPTEKLTHCKNVRDVSIDEPNNTRY